jgi:hypothetical protein
MSMKVSKTLPAPQYADGTINTDSDRANGYGEKFFVPIGLKKYPLADEGSYYVALNPTPGTGIAGHAAPTTFDNTKPFIMIKNGNASGGRSIYLDLIKLVLTVAGAGGTLNYATHVLDAGAGFTSGGSTLSPASPNGNITPNSNATIYCGAVVATAGGSQRLVANQRVRTPISVVGDVTLYDFGGAPVPTGGVLEGTTESERFIVCPPVIIPPQGFYKLVLWRGSQSGANSYEAEIGYWER